MSEPLYQSAPRNLGELLERVEKAWTTLDRTVKTLSDEQLEQSDGGTWKIKDHIAHVAAWEQRIVGVLNGRPSHEAIGIDPSVWNEEGTDSVNEAIYQAHKDRPTAQVLEEFRTTHQSLVDTLHGLDDKALQRSYNSFGVDDLGERSNAPILREIVSDTYEHYLEHEEMIQSVVGPS